MNQKLSIFSLSLFIFGIFTWCNAALSAPPKENIDVELCWYSGTYLSIVQSQTEAKRILLCVYRNGSGQPALLYQKQADQYYPVPLVPSTGGLRQDSAKIKRGLRPFKNTFLGVPQAEEEKTVRFQKALNANADGDWGVATWTAFINRLEEELGNQKEKVVEFSDDSGQSFLTARVINLSQIDLNKVESGELKAVLVRALANIQDYQPKQMTTFAVDLLSAYQTYHEKITAATTSTPSKQPKTIKPKNNGSTTRSDDTTTTDEQNTKETKASLDDKPKSVMSLDWWKIIILALSFLVITFATGFVVWFFIRREVETIEAKISFKVNEWFNRSAQEHQTTKTDILRELIASKNNFDAHVEWEQEEIGKLHQQNETLNENLKILSERVETLAEKISTLEEHTNRSRQLNEKAEQIKRNCENQLQEMAQQYTEGYGIQLDDYGSNSLSLLNRLTLHITAWKNEVERQEPNGRLHEILSNGEKYFTDILRQIRQNVPEPRLPIQVNTQVHDDDDVEALQQECDGIVSEFKEDLQMYEQDSAEQVADGDYDKSFRNLIVNQLFEGVAGLFPHDDLPQPLIQILSLVELEVIGIEVGKTKAHPRLHEVREIKSSPDAQDAIVEVVFPGLRDSKTQDVIRKAVVIKEEPEQVRYE